MELGLQKIGNNDITPSGAMYIEKLADTLHRVRKYKVSLYGDRTKEISHESYERLAELLQKQQLPKFIKFKDGEVIATNQILGIKPFEVIVDTRKENL